MESNSRVTSLPEACSDLLQDITTASGNGDLKKVSLLVERWCSEWSESITELGCPVMYPLNLALKVAAYYNQAHIADFLVRSGCSVDDREVVEAATNGKSIDVLQVLLDRGWNVNVVHNGIGRLITNVLGKEVLQNETLLKWFLAHGYNPTNPEIRPPNYIKRTSIDIAAELGLQDAVSQLIAYGGNIKQTNALHRVVRNSDRKIRHEMAKFLLRSGVKVNAFEIRETSKSVRDPGYEPELYTALHWAIISGHHDIVPLLIENGADPVISPSRGMTTVQLAISKYHFHLLPLLNKERRPQQARSQNLEQDPEQDPKPTSEQGGLVLLPKR